MPLSTGTRLGPYEILAPIGAGRMGEVCKARDTRLDRTAAIKVSAAFKVPPSLQRRNCYAVTHDGQRFLVVVPEKEGPPSPSMVVVNWPALLPKK